MKDIILIEKELEEKEKKMDEILMNTRIAVRFCANSIKSLHSKNFIEAKKNLADAEKILKKIKKYRPEFRPQIDHIFQEYVEAKVLFAIVLKKPIPTLKQTGSLPVPYLLGLLDCTGELKREMYESLRKGDKKEAERYFSHMENIFDSLIHLKFSNSVLPDFRRKQDVARIQIEQARGELI
ncbi:MAG: RNA-binding protein [Candidatus Micrarchaeia archaeon]